MINNLCGNCGKLYMMEVCEYCGYSDAHKVRFQDLPGVARIKRQ